MSDALIPSFSSLKILKAATQTKIWAAVRNTQKRARPECTVCMWMVATPSRRLWIPAEAIHGRSFLDLHSFIPLIRDFEGQIHNPKISVRTTNRLSSQTGLSFM